MIFDHTKTSLVPGSEFSVLPAIEVTKPDYSQAYVSLAPLVCEAWAFLQCGNIDKASEALRLARRVVEMADMVSVVVAKKDDNT